MEGKLPGQHSRLISPGPAAAEAALAQSKARKKQWLGQIPGRPFACEKNPTAQCACHLPEIPTPQTQNRESLLPKVCTAAPHGVRCSEPHTRNDFAFSAALGPV